MVEISGQSGLSLYLPPPIRCWLSFALVLFQLFEFLFESLGFIEVQDLQRQQFISWRNFAWSRVYLSPALDIVQHCKAFL